MLRICLVFAAILAACGSAKEGSDPGLIRADIARIDDVIAADESVHVLAEVDGAVEDRLPVRAAEMIRAAAIPSITKTRTALAGLHIVSPEVSRLLSIFTTAESARAAALEAYASALARGEVEDERLLDALHAHRTAENAWLRSVTELDALREQTKK